MLLLHPRKPRLSQSLVQHDGSAVGEVERADAVVVRVDEIATDVLLKNRLVAVFGVSERLFTSFPCVGVAERVAVAEYRDAFATFRCPCKQRLRDAAALAAEHKIVAIALRGLRVRAPRLLSE